MSRRAPTRAQFAEGRRWVVRWLLDDAEWFAAQGKLEPAFRCYREAVDRLLGRIR